MLQTVLADLEPAGHDVEGAAHAGELIVARHRDPMRKVVRPERRGRLLQPQERRCDRAIEPSRQEATDDRSDQQRAERGEQLEALSSSQGRDLVGDLLNVQRVQVAQQRYRLVELVVEGIEQGVPVGSRSRGGLSDGSESGFPARRGHRCQGPFLRCAQRGQVDESLIDPPAQLREVFGSAGSSVSTYASPASSAGREDPSHRRCEPTRRRFRSGIPRALPRWSGS